MAGIYIHIPFCKSKCRYCDFTSYPGKIGFAEAYMACLYKEMKLRGKELKGKIFDTVYFGGGTPSVIDEKLIVGCMNCIRRYFTLSDGAEITIEVNPGTVTEEKIKTYKKCGINRFSIGLQSSDNEELEDLGRIHTADDFAQTCRLIGDVNKSADVMIGLKDQTFEKVERTIRFADSFGVNHISMYALTPEDGTPIYTDYLNGELPDGDEVAEIYDKARKLLASLGYYRYEVSNFAKKGFESRHNLNYWERGEYIGFGVAASSFMCGRRFTNTPDLDEYIKCILSDFYPVVDDEKISGRDAEFEKIMLALRTSEGLDLVAFAREFGKDFNTEYAEAIKKHLSQLDISDTRLKIKDEYLYVQNTIIIDFLKD